MRKAEKCIYCGMRRKVNHRLACRECQGKLDVTTVQNGYYVMMNGTGEEEDAMAEKMWDILDGHPERKRYEHGR